MDLHDYIANRLGITKIGQIECIKNILDNTILLNEYKTGKLSEEKLDMLVKITGVYLGEVIEVMHDPTKYKEKLQDVNNKVLNEVENG